MKCSQCGAYIPDNAQFCPRCGAFYETPDAQPVMQQRVRTLRLSEEPAGQQNQKTKILIAVCSVLTVVLVIVILFFILSALNPTDRALHLAGAGRAEEAAALYEQQIADNDRNRTQLETIVAQRIEEICLLYREDALDLQEAEEAIRLYAAFPNTAIRASISDGLQQLQQSDGQPGEERTTAPAPTTAATTAPTTEAPGYALSAFVYDALTREPVANVSIAVTSGDGLETVNTVTDASGCFTVETKTGGQYIITLRHPQYNDKQEPVTMSGFTGGNYSITMTPKETPTARERLYSLWTTQIVGINGKEEVAFIVDDFDANGTYEAFGICGVFIGNEIVEQYTDVEIYYLYFENDSATCVLYMDTAPHGVNLYGKLGSTPESGSDSNLTIGGNTARFIVWELDASGSGTTSIILGVRNGQVYQPQISGDYMSFSQQGDNMYHAYTSDFSNGYHEYIDHYFTLNEATGEFIPV